MTRFLTSNHKPMKLFIIHIISLLLLIGTGKAMSDPPGVYEEKAIKILNKTSATIKAYDALYLEFEYLSSGSSMGLFDDIKGYIYVSGEKYYINAGDIHFISDGVVAWTFLKDVNEVHISYLEDAEGAITPLSLLDNFEDEFKPLWLRQETLENGELVEIIDLVPLEHQPFNKYRLAISTQSNHVLYTVAFDAHGESFTYLITKTIINPEVPADIFSFDPDDHPDIEVVDLR